MSQKGRAYDRFQRALSKGEALLPRCADCGKSFYYPRLHCPRCFGPNISLETAPSPLSIRGFSWVWRPQSPAQVAALPVLMIAAGSVDLSIIAEGEGWSESAPPSVGETVELAVSRRTSGEPLVVFRPALQPQTVSNSR